MSRHWASSPFVRRRRAVPSLLSGRTTWRRASGARGSAVRRMLSAILTAATGAVAMYYLDPDRGRRRRAITRDRAAALVRRRVRRAERIGRAAAAEAYGIGQQALHAGSAAASPPSDAALKAKVETELFADPDFPKGRVNVNVEDGRVVLRGELPRPEEIAAADARVRTIAGVREVENLLHLLKTPARMS